MQKWYMVGTYDSTKCKVDGVKKFFPHVVRGNIVTTLQRTPVQHGQAEFILNRGEHVRNEAA